MAQPAAAPAQTFEDRWSKFYAAAAFDEDQPTNSPVPSPSKGDASTFSSSAVPNAAHAGALQPQDEAELEKWLNDFENRMSQKQEAMEKKAFLQLKADGDEIDKWHDYHQEEAAKERQREAEEAERERQEELRKEREEVENAEQLYIERSTANMTPRSKQRWMQDNDEINALERRLSAHDSKMEKLNGHIGALVGKYEERLQKEAEEAQRIAAEEEQTRLELEEKLRNERATVADEFIAAVMEAFAESCEYLWETLKPEANAQRAQATQVARDRVYQTLSEYDLGRVEAAKDNLELRAELLDELVEVDVLRQKLKKQLKR